MHSVVAPPELGDVMSMLAYVLGHPHLFIGSTTVMTTMLVFAVGLVTAVAATGGVFFPPVRRTSDLLLDWIAPRFALVLAWFGVGSMLLATQILIRFHDVFPSGTEIQFRSGLGHLAVAIIGILLLRPRLLGLSARSWVGAHFWALAYLTFHVMVLTPPWFNFMFQGELISGIAQGTLATAVGFNLYLWWRLPRG